MSSIVLQIPKVKNCRSDRPNRCPFCDGTTFQRWGGAAKSVRDPKISEVLVYRYRCCQCKHTFRHYPEGVERASQTRRTRALAVIAWTFGMSYRKLAAFLGALEAPIERMTAWRDVQEKAEHLRRKHHWGRVRVLGLDGAYVRGWGEIQPVLVAVDMGNGQTVDLGQLDEKNPQAVKRFLEPLMQRLGVSVVVTDDLVSYKIVAEALGLEHQICQFHVRRWVGRTLFELRETVPKDWIWVVEEVHQLIQELPLHGDRRLLQLWRQVPQSRKGRRSQALSALDQLRLLLVRLSQDWSRYRVFDWDKEVPWTNNLTEQVIGKMKMRARTVRGYKTWSGMKNGLLLSASQWE